MFNVLLMLDLGTDENLGTVFKFVVIGDQGVGKTSFIRKMIHKRFRPTHHPTFDAEIVIHEMDDVSLLIYDIPGDLSLRKYRKHYFEKADGIFYIFDITKEIDMLQLSYWLTDLADTLDSSVNIAVIGNKIDLSEERELTTDFLLGTEILLIDQIFPRAIKTFEVSSRTAKGVEPALNWLLQESLSQQQEEAVLVEKVFDPSNIYSVLFKLTEYGPADVYRDFNQLPQIDDVEVYLVNMGISIISAIGQGHNYSEGVYDMPDHGRSGYRRFIYSFRMQDSTTQDHRLDTGFFQMVLLIPDEYYQYYIPFSSVTRKLEEFIAHVGDYALFDQEFFNEFVLLILTEFRKHYGK